MPTRCAQYAVLVAAVLAAGGAAAVWSLHRTDRALRSDLLAQASLVAQGVGIERLKGLTGTAADEGTPDYLRLKEQLARAKAAHAKCRFIYLLGRRPDGQVYFFVDNEPVGGDDESPAGQLYEEVTPEDLQAFEQKRALTVGPAGDRWGTWITALVPILDAASASSGLVTPDDARAVVREAVDFCRTRGREALLRELGDPAGRFRRGRLNVFAYDPRTASVVPSDLASDVEGTAAAQLRDAIRAGRSGWIDHCRETPAGGPAGANATYGEWVDELMVCAEAYRGTGEVVAVLGMDVDARTWRWDVLARAAFPLGVILSLAILAIAAFRSAAVRPGAAVKPVQRRLLVPLTLIVLLSIAGFHAAVTSISRVVIDQASRHVLTDGLKWIEGGLTARAESLAALTEPIARSESLQDAIRTGNASRLRRDWRPVFDALAEDHGILDFHVYGPDLRPVMSLTSRGAGGRPAGSVTAGEARRTGRTAAGIELAADGALTLRAAQPVAGDEETAGYVEISRNALDLLRPSDAARQLQVMVLVRKSALRQAEWEQAAGVTGRRSQWNRLPDRVLLHSSLPLQETERMLSRWMPAAEGARPPSDAGTAARIATGLLRDVSGAEVGDLVLTYDVGETLASLHRLRSAISGLALPLVAGLTGVLFLLVRRTDEGIVAQQRELWQSEAKLRMILEHSRDLIWNVDPQGELTYVSPAIASAAGHRPADLMGSRLWKLVHEEDRASFRGLLDRVVQTRHTLQTPDYRLRHADGSWRWHVATCTPVLDDRDRVVSIVGVSRDVTERKLAERGLEEQNRRLEDILTGTKAGTWDWDIPTGSITVNRRWAEMLGWSLEELVPVTIDSWCTGVDPDDLRLVQNELDRHLRGESDTYDAEFRNRHRNGGWVWIHSRGKVVEWTADRRPARMRGTHLDITKRKRAEAALRESEHLLRATIDALTASIVLLDGQGRIVLANQKWTEFSRETGIDRAQGAVGANFLELYRPLEADPAGGMRQVANGIRDVLHAERESFSIEVPYLGRDKQQWFSARALTVHAEGVKYVVVAHQEITERKEAEAERERLVSAMEQAAEMFVITNLDGAILYVNPAFERVTGYTFAEVAGATPRLFKSGRHDAAFYQGMWNTLCAGETWIGRITNRRKDGTLYTAEAAISPVLNQAGRTVSFVAVTRDITEQLRQDEQFRQAQKVESIGRLAGGVAHDLNNLLSPVLGYAELLQLDLDRDDPRQESVAEILNAANRARDLVRQLLAFSRKQTLQTRVVDLNAAILGFQKLLSRTIREDIEIDLRLSPDPLLIVADLGQIEQVIMNLAVNAADAMQRGGRLVIETARHLADRKASERHAGMEPGPYAMLAIADTGCGMDETTLNHLFEPFYSTKGELGTGLGLATVYGIVKQHGGLIQVHSELERGSRFTVYLPAADGAHGKMDDTTSPPLDMEGSETILLVDDNEPVRQLACSILSRRGYRVLTAGDGRQALKILADQTGNVDLLVTDVVMPGLSGRELYVQGSAFDPDLQVLYMSGYASDVIADRGVLDRDVHFVHKPFSAKELAAKVREALTAERPQTHPRA